MRSKNKKLRNVGTKKFIVNALKKEKILVCHKKNL